MSETNGAIDLGSLAPVEVYYRIGGNQYVLREASEAAASLWERSRINSRDYSDEGKFLGLRAESEELGCLLLSLCLSKVIADSGDESKVVAVKPVPLEEIKHWPTRVTTPLIRKCKEISQLDQTDDLATLEKELELLQKKIAKLRESGPKN